MSLINLSDCHWDKDKGSLSISSEAFAGGFPREIEVLSHHSNRKIKFIHVPEGHKLFDPDCWDGELCMYIPTTLCKIVYLTVYHSY